MFSRKAITKLGVVVLLVALCAPMAHADNRYIVRHSRGLLGINLSCLLLGCTVQYGLGDSAGQLYLISAPSTQNPVVFLLRLLLDPGVLDAEPDLPVQINSGSVPGAVPDALYDKAPMTYYGATVRHGYVNQPATQIIGLSGAQTGFRVSGGGVVAVIDTGVDTHHAVLQSVLLPGYDFTSNANGADETGGVSQSTAAVLDGGDPVFVNQSTAAVLDQSTAAVLDGSGFSAYGHGTMVAGLVHLVAPTARILPLRAFGPDGSGKVSDVIRAIYYAANHGATVINMSFSFNTPSLEVTSAVNYAVLRGAVPVAAAGNDGQNTRVYPAANSNVIGVASTTNFDTRSTFSNYGSMVFVAAPGEGVVTLYPNNTYAAGWGTSFSTPLVSGTIALLQATHSGCDEYHCSSAVGNAQWISTELGHGRIDEYQAIRAWRTANRMP